MSKSKETMIDIEDDIRGCVLSFKQIAYKNNVSLEFVQQVWEQMCEQEEFD